MKNKDIKNVADTNQDLSTTTTVEIEEVVKSYDSDGAYTNKSVIKDNVLIEQSSDAKNNSDDLYKVDFELNNLSPEALKKVLNDNNITFFKSLRMRVIKDLLEDIVYDTREKCLTLELRLNYRLLWFNRFSEYQLVLLLDTFKNKNLISKYIHNLIAAVVNSSKKDIKKDIKKALDNPDNILEIDDEFDVFKYNDEFNDIFLEENGSLDGIPSGKFRPIIYNSATRENIYAIAKKYNIDIPDKLNKDNIAEYVYAVAKHRNIDSILSVKELKTHTVADIKKIARKYKIKTSTEITKQDAIEFLLASAPETKQNYKLIELKDNPYNMEIPVFFNDGVKIETVKREIIKEVPETVENIIEEEEIVYVDSPEEKMPKWVKFILFSLWTMIFIGLCIVTYLIISRVISKSDGALIINKLFSLLF